MSDSKRLTSLKPHMFTAYYDWFLENEITPHLMVDVNIPGVKVPMEYVKQGCIILSLSPTAIADYQCLKSGISFKARFKGQTEDIFIPFLAMSQLVALESGAALPIGKALEQLELGEPEDLTPDEGVQTEPSIFSIDDEEINQGEEEPGIYDMDDDDNSDDSIFDDEAECTELFEEADGEDSDDSDDSDDEEPKGGKSGPGFEFVE